MATTAKQSSTSTTSTSSSVRPSTQQLQQQQHQQQQQQLSTGTGSNNLQKTNYNQEGQEDIATIAKQISDHAEAIYQTWKARGLAPTEILNCHTTSDAFGNTLKQQTIQRNKESPVTELLAQTPDMSNNNLEKLVNTFVNEDKARLAARNRNSTTTTTTGTIQYALKKFEKNDGPKINNKNSIISPTTPTTPTGTTTTTPLNKNVPDVLMNTIDQVLPNDLTSPTSHCVGIIGNNTQLLSPTSNQKPQTPAKPASLMNHVPSWPLKNRLGSSPPFRKETSPTKEDTTNRIISKKTADLLDEVSREEERLINALKTGLIINNEKILPEVITSTLLNEKIDRNDWSKPDVSSTTITQQQLQQQQQQQLSPATSTWNGIQLKPVSGHVINSPLHKNDDLLSSTSSSLLPLQSLSSNSLSSLTSLSPHHNSTFAKSSKPRAPRTENVPHPELSATRNLAMRSTSSSPVRPFLTRGSVAERVLIFERCPEIKVPPRNIVEKPLKIQTKQIVKPLPSHTTLQRHIRNSAKNVYIPRFHFPHGKPLPTITIETTLQRIQAEFNSFPNNQVPRDSFHHIVTACGVPLYWRSPLFFCTPLTATGLVDGYKFIEFWKQMSAHCNDAPSRFVFILSKGNRSRPYVLPEDFGPLVQDVVDTHPGLSFLKEAAEFHSRYIHTVIARIYYSVNRSWTGRITIPEVRRSNLLQVIQLLEEEDDINQITQFFSYEHFYVIYCKFWELDRDHDLLIDQNDLARHNDHALSSAMIERIFSGCVTRKIRSAGAVPHSKMTYAEFVFFLLAEEDKSHPTAIEYWFRCMDLDGDGILSMYELQHFYEEQQKRMEALGIEILPFADCVCQMLDMIKPVQPGCITLGDLKRCKTTPIFFDTFFNFEKYMDNEQRDPFASQRDSDDQISDWDRYAAIEYEYLVSEESGDTQGSCDEENDYESSIDILDCETQIDDFSNEW